MIRRRDFLSLAGSAAAVTGLPHAAVVRAQQAPRKVPRVAIVTSQPITNLDTPAGVAAFDATGDIPAFLAEFARLGFVERKTVSLDRYSAPTSADQNAIARVIVNSAPDLIVVQASPVLGPALEAATTTIPILVGTADPIASGIVSNLLPTGRNLAAVSGTASSNFEGKCLALLAETVPSARLAAYMFADPPGALIASRQNNIDVVTDAAAKLGVSVNVIRADETGDEKAFRAAFDQARAAGVGMIQLGRNQQVGAASAILAGLCAAYQMPGISDYHPFTRAGGLMSYGQPEGDQYQKVAQYAAMILNGTNPGTLPVLQPEVFDLIVNLTAAKTLGIPLPTTILAQATEVIQ